MLDADFPPFCAECLEGYSSVQKLNPFWFYRLGVYLGNLKKLPRGSTTASAWGAIVFAKEALRSIADQPEAPLPNVRPLALDLLKDLEFLGWPSEGGELDDSLLQNLSRKIEHLQSTMQTDLRYIDTFVVQPLAIYDTRALLERAEGNLGNAAQARLIPSTREDLRHAGACLAFRQFTAAGFYSLRAVEAEARRYYEAITGKIAGPELSFGKVASYISDQYTAAETAWVKAGKSTPRQHDALGVIGSLLVRITVIYRNPIMHPEMTLEEDRALEVFGLVSQVISAIAEDTAARNP